MNKDTKTKTKTRDIATTSVTDVTRTLKDLGSTIISRETTPGACGYTRITYTLPD